MDFGDLFCCKEADGGFFFHDCLEQAVLLFLVVGRHALGIAGGARQRDGFLLRFGMWCVRVLDYFGLLPQRLLDASPFHGSMIISDLGSLGIPPIYHHLYNLGNLPVFITFGAKYKVNEINRNGELEEHKYVDFTAVTDERVCDGFYYATAFKRIKFYLKNPQLLELPPERVEQDVF